MYDPMASMELFNMGIGMEQPLVKPPDELNKDRTVELVKLSNDFAFDLFKKEFHDYLWILGLKYGEKAKFEKIEYLFIKKSNVSQVMRSQVQSTTFRKEVFDGYLKFSEVEKIHLITRGNKNDLIKGLRVIATKLNVKIVDYSEGKGKVI